MIYSTHISDNEEESRVKMEIRSAKEYNDRFLNNLKTKPNNISALEWNRHLDELKSQGKYNGEIYVHTRTRIDELFEIEQELKEQ